MISEIYRLAVTTEGVDCARLIADWHELEAAGPGDSDGLTGGDDPVILRPCGSSRSSSSY